MDNNATQIIFIVAKILNPRLSSFLDVDSPLNFEFQKTEQRQIDQGGQVHVKTVSHVCHRLEIPKPIQSLKKAGNL